MQERSRGDRPFGERGRFGRGEQWLQPHFLGGDFEPGDFGDEPIRGPVRWTPAGSGPHAGKGPKGYQRPDELVLEDACDALERHPAIDASEIEVSCREGALVLRGTVESRAMKRLAEDCVEHLPGVRDVGNELRLAPPLRGSESDATS